MRELKHWLFSMLALLLVIVCMSGCLNKDDSGECHFTSCDVFFQATSTQIFVEICYEFDCGKGSVSSFCGQPSSDIGCTTLGTPAGDNFEVEKIECTQDEYGLKLICDNFKTGPPKNGTLKDITEECRDQQGNICLPKGEVN